MTDQTRLARATAQTLDTPDGPFTIVADDTGRVLASGWTDDAPALAQRVHPSIRPAELAEGSIEAADAVERYYAGDLAAIDSVRVRQHGTELQLAGWAQLRSIPRGAPLTYTEFAVALGKPSAARVAASICARNAPALFVPCHRVLRGDGSLGGFAWGLGVKGALLDRESR